jgi:hypothetical protein
VSGVAAANPTRHSSATARFGSLDYPAVMHVPRVPGSRRIMTVALGAGLALTVAACSATGGGSTSDPSTGCATAPTPAPDSMGSWTAPQAPSLFPQVINPAGTLACGENRFMFSFLDAANAPVAAPDRPASVAFYDLGSDPETPVSTVDGSFIWAIEDVAGIYVAKFGRKAVARCIGFFRNKGSQGRYCIAPFRWLRLRQQWS